MQAVPHQKSGWAHVPLAGKFSKFRLCKSDDKAPLKIVLFFFFRVKMQRPSLTVILSGVFLAYIAYSMYTIYLLFHPEPCKVPGRCINPYLAKNPVLEVGKNRKILFC